MIFLIQNIFFSKYFTDDLFKDLVTYTNLYAVQNNTYNFPSTNDQEMNAFVGLHMLMGILDYPRVRMYWEDRFKIPLITDKMNVNRFFKLRQNLHVVDNEAKSPTVTDRFWKVRPIYDAIKSRCSQLVPEEHLSIDEQMVPFKGQINVKQFIKNKPIRWGIKIFMICGQSGMLYDFIIYQGATTEIKPELKQFGLGASVVMQLSQSIKLPNSFLYFDNFFTSYWLLQYLTDKSIYAIGTVRQDRFCKPPFTENKIIKKNEARGFAEEVVSGDAIVLTKWYDNSFVILGSNYVGQGHTDKCRRWDKAQRRYIEVQRPEVVKKYNDIRGGVDKLDFCYLFTGRLSVRKSGHSECSPMP